MKKLYLSFDDIALKRPLECQLQKAIKFDSGPDLTMATISPALEADDMAKGTYRISIIVFWLPEGYFLEAASEWPTSPLRVAVCHMGPNALPDTNFVKSLELIALDKGMLYFTEDEARKDLYDGPQGRGLPRWPEGES